MALPPGALQRLQQRAAGHGGGLRPWLSSKKQRAAPAAAAAPPAKAKAKGSGVGSGSGKDDFPGFAVSAPASPKAPAGAAPADGTPKKARAPFAPCRCMLMACCTAIRSSACSSSLFVCSSCVRHRF